MKYLTLNRLIIAIVFIAIFAMSARTPTDTDSWWHLQSGRYIVENQTLPQTDPFSHTRLGEPWINHGWLPQVALYLTFDTLSYPGLVLVLSSAITLAFAFAWRQRRGSDLWLSAFTFIIAATATSIIWAVRPQLISFVLTGIVAYLLHRFKQGHERALWWLPAVMLVWVNSHGGFAIGFILIIAYIFGETGNAILNPRETFPVFKTWKVWEGLPRNLQQLLVVFLVCFLIVPLNPNGIEMWGYPFRTVGIGVLSDFIAEWQSPDFQQIFMHPFIWLLLAALTAFGLAGRRADFTDLTLVAVFTYLSLLAVRNIPLFALVTAPIIVRYGSEALVQWRGKVSTPTRPGFPLLNCFLLSLILLLALIRVSQPMFADINEQEQAQTLPAGAIAYLQENQPPGPLYNFYNWGGYLIWQAPDYPTFVDGRTDLYDDDFIRNYLAIYFASPAWEGQLDQFGINLVLVEPLSPLAQQLATRPGWQTLYQDDVAILFARQTP